MTRWGVDIGLAVLLSGLEVAALVAFWFVEGLRRWAARGGRVPGATGRSFLALSVGPVSLATSGHGLHRAGPRVACASQAVLAALLVSLLVLDAGSECGGRIRRRRLRRERRRPHGGG